MEENRDSNPLTLKKSPAGYNTHIFVQLDRGNRIGLPETLHASSHTL